MRIFPNKWSLKSKGLFSKLIEFYFRWTKKLKRVSALQYNIFDKLRCFEDPRHSLNSTNAPPSSKTIIELLLFVATKAVICWTPFLLRHRFQRGDTTTIIQVCHSYTVSVSMSVSACKCVFGCACMRVQVGVCVCEWTDGATQIRRAWVQSKMFSCRVSFSIEALKERQQQQQQQWQQSHLLTATVSAQRHRCVTDTYPRERMATCEQSKMELLKTKNATF